MPFFGSRLRPSYELVDEGIGVILLIKTQLLRQCYLRHGAQSLRQPLQHGVIITGPRRELLNFPIGGEPADDLVIIDPVRKLHAAHDAPPFSGTISAIGLPSMIAPARSVACRNGSSMR